MCACISNSSYLLLRMSTFILGFRNFSKFLCLQPINCVKYLYFLASEIIKLEETWQKTHATVTAMKKFVLAKLAVECSEPKPAASGKVGTSSEFNHGNNEDINVVLPIEQESRKLEHALLSDEGTESNNVFQLIKSDELCINASKIVSIEPQLTVCQNFSSSENQTLIETKLEINGCEKIDPFSDEPLNQASNYLENQMISSLENKTLMETKLEINGWENIDPYSIEALIQASIYIENQNEDKNNFAQNSTARVSGLNDFNCSPLYQTSSSSTPRKVKPRNISKLPASEDSTSLCKRSKSNTKPDSSYEWTKRPPIVENMTVSNGLNQLKLKNKNLTKISRIKAVNIPKSTPVKNSLSKPPNSKLKIPCDKLKTPTKNRTQTPGLVSESSRLVKSETKTLKVLYPVNKKPAVSEPTKPSAVLINKNESSKNIDSANQVYVKVSPTALINKENVGYTDVHIIDFAKMLAPNMPTQMQTFTKETEITDKQPD